jgi:hypothetical protein
MDASNTQRVSVRLDDEEEEVIQVPARQLSTIPQTPEQIAERQKKQKIKQVGCPSVTRSLGSWRFLPPSKITALSCFSVWAINYYWTFTTFLQICHCLHTNISSPILD